mmetsp:Transcript_39309/g.82664  ORF Transcript_39309/g.82664 Transcript_39309/m.82664 type:complete len:322 (+) Transcript_39309:229-1194(+)
MSASRNSTLSSGNDVDVLSAFNKIDVDGSKSISKKEMWSYISQKEELGVSKKDFNTLFNAIDDDKSGAIDVLEYARFMEKVQQMRGGTRIERGCMKGSRQRSSIAPSERPKLKKNKLNHVSTRLSHLLNARRQISFRRSNLDLDSSNPMVYPEKNELRFFDVEVREYDVTVSDNPGVRAGVAIELSWNYHITDREHIDTFEERRSQERSKDFKKEKKLTRLEREKILRESGATQKEIDEAAKRAASIRNARKKSIAMRQHDKFYESVEKRTSFVKKIFGGRRRSSASKEGTLDLERLHPTLMAMMGTDGSETSRSSNIGAQ